MGPHDSLCEGPGRLFQQLCIPVEAALWVRDAALICRALRRDAVWEKRASGRRARPQPRSL